LLQRRYIPAPGAPTPRPGRTPAPEAGPPKPPGFATGCACTPTPAAPRPAPGSTPAPEAGPPTPPAPTPGVRVRPAPAAPKPAPGATPAPDAGPPIPPGLGRAIAAPQAAMASATPITTCPARFCMRCMVETNGDFQENCHSWAATQAASINGNSKGSSCSSVGLFIHTSAG
jgi:hypothetical protein